MVTDSETKSIAPDPPALAAEVRNALREKSELSFNGMATLGTLAGAFIALGGLFALIALAGASELPHGVGQVLAGAVFTLGLVLVVVAGAELFTGNTLMVGLVATGSLSWGTLIRVWCIVYAANFVGALVIAAIAFGAGVHTAGDGAVGRAALEIAEKKSALTFGAAFFSGILANMLVCLAVWMAYSARNTGDKLLAVVLPISAFVAAGLEHSIANMYLIPYGWLIKIFADSSFWDLSGASIANYASISPIGFLTNLLSVTVGNIIGGAVIALAYTQAYSRSSSVK